MPVSGFLREIIKIVLDEINRNEGTDYQMKDVYFNFVREVITNAKDNAEIELTDAQKEGQMLENLLKVNNILDDETIIREVCAVLDIDYEEIKGRVAAGEGETQTVRKMLENIVPE